VKKNATLLITFLTLTVFGLLFSAGCKEADTGSGYDINGKWDFILTFNNSTVARSQYLTFTGTGVTGNVEIEGENVGVYIVDETQSGTSVIYSVTIIIQKEDIYTYTFTGKFSDEKNMSGSFTLVEEGVTSNGKWTAER
jgi:hypothetical protein